VLIRYAAGHFQRSQFLKKHSMTGLAAVTALPLEVEGKIIGAMEEPSHRGCLQPDNDPDAPGRPRLRYRARLPDQQADALGQVKLNRDARYPCVEYATGT
jgi:hypothetical protein